MDEDLQKRIERAKELLNTAKHAALATVNEDGSPHNTPLRLLYDPNLEYIYWSSYPESTHSLNIERTGKAFVVLYDATQKGGLYIKTENAHALLGEELSQALSIYNEVRVKEGLEPLPMNYYMEDSPQRMWSAEITNFWVNSTERNSNGQIVKDGRKEISAKDLLN